MDARRGLRFGARKSFNNAEPKATAASWPDSAVAFGSALNEASAQSAAHTPDHGVSGDVDRSDTADYHWSDGVIEVRRNDLRQAIIALILTLDVLICPFACNGSIAVAGCGDACCPPQSDSSQPNAPQPADHDCDGSCGSCLCGGAVTGDETLDDTQVVTHAAFELSLPEILVGQSNNPTADWPTHDHSDSPPARTGAALRALFQSFLL